MPIYMPKNDATADISMEKLDDCGLGFVPVIAANVGSVLAPTAASSTANLSVFFIVCSPWRGYALSEPKPSPPIRE
jgi:hypothetical protein